MNVTPPHGYLPPPPPHTHTRAHHCVNTKSAPCGEGVSASNAPNSAMPANTCVQVQHMGASACVCACVYTAMWGCAESEPEHAASRHRSIRVPYTRVRAGGTRESPPHANPPPHPSQTPHTPLPHAPAHTCHSELAVMNPAVTPSGAHTQPSQLSTTAAYTANSCPRLSE